MRYVVLDTDVASRAIKDQLGDPMAARLTGTAWCVTFVTVGELWQWATTRKLGTAYPGAARAVARPRRGPALR